MERAEPTGGITIAKLAEVATTLNCSLVYILVPNETIQETVEAEARRAAASILGYAGRTMALEAQEVDQRRQREAVQRLAHDLIDRGALWQRSPLAQHASAPTP